MLKHCNPQFRCRTNPKFPSRHFASWQINICFSHDDSRPTEWTHLLDPLSSLLLREINWRLSKSHSQVVNEDCKAHDRKYRNYQQWLLRPHCCYRVGIIGTGTEPSEQRNPGNSSISNLLWSLADPPPASNFYEQNVPSAANSWARSFWMVWLLKWIWFFHHSPFNFFSSSSDLNLKITRKCKYHFSLGQRKNLSFNIPWLVFF